MEFDRKFEKLKKKFENEKISFTEKDGTPDWWKGVRHRKGYKTRDETNDGMDLVETLREKGRHFTCITSRDRVVYKTPDLVNYERFLVLSRTVRRHGGRDSTTTTVGPTERGERVVSR